MKTAGLRPRVIVQHGALRVATKTLRNIRVTTVLLGGVALTPFLGSNSNGGLNDCYRRSWRAECHAPQSRTRKSPMHICDNFIINTVLIIRAGTSLKVSSWTRNIVTHTFIVRFLFACCNFTKIPRFVKFGCWLFVQSHYVLCCMWVVLTTAPQSGLKSLEFLSLRYFLVLEKGYMMVLTVRPSYVTHRVTISRQMSTYLHEGSNWH